MAGHDRSLKSSDPRVMGPREVRIDFLWTKAWAALDKGEVTGFWTATAEAELATFQASLPAASPADAADIRAASSKHLAQLKHFDAEIVKIDHFRSLMDDGRKSIMATQIEAAQTVAKTLLSAHGAIALGTLTLISGPLGSSIEHPLVWVLICCSTGFLIVLLMLHLATRMALKPIGILTTLTLPNLSKAKREESSPNSKRRARGCSFRVTSWGIARPLFWSRR